MQMEEREIDDGHPWPADMERRRKAALQKLYQNFPEYKFMSEQLQVTNRNQGGGKSGSLTSSSVIKERRPRDKLNRWTVETTLELLEAMKAYVRADKVWRIGVGIEKWKAVTINLSNPRGLNLSNLARSSMNRLAELRRNNKEGLLEIAIQQSLIDYNQICELHQPPGFKKSTFRPPCTLG